MKNAWPVLAQGTGGRNLRGKIDDQNFDNYGIEYTFPDDTKFFYYGRSTKNCEQRFGVYGQGTKGAFTISTSGHSPARSAIYKGPTSTKENLVWAATQPEPNPYRQEWQHLVAAIISGEPYNEIVRGAQASMVTAMGRFAAHTGKPIKYDEMLASPDDITAAVATLTDDSPAFLTANPDGSYPRPNPGQYKYEYRD